MFTRSTSKGTAAPGAGATQLGEGSFWQGEIRTGPADLRVEGAVEGTILSEGHVTVGPTGVVKGAIHAKRLSVLGRVEGLFKVEDCLEILGTGWVEGEVELGTLVVDQGGTLLGTCLRRAPLAPKEPVPLVPRREEPLPDRPAPSHNGTHGGPHDLPRPARGPGWMKP